MTREEPGKDEDTERAPSSVELSPAASAATAEAEIAAPESQSPTDVAQVEAAAEAESGRDGDQDSQPVTATAEDSAGQEPADAAELPEPAEASQAAEAPEPAEASQAAEEPEPAEASQAAEAPEPAQEPEMTEEPEPAAEPEADPASEQEASPAPVAEAPPTQPEQPKYRRGQVYSGVITKTSPTAVHVDLGDGGEGIVPGRELELMTRKMLESLVAGAEVDVYVVNPRNHRGETVLSINHALEEMDWRKAEEFAKSKQVYDALIGGYNKGGLIVRFGRLRGFVPQSQLAEDRMRSAKGATPEERYGPMVNQPVGVKVMEVDRSRNRLILSERAALREVRQRRKQALIEELKLGEIRRGTVVSLENFGAFVDIGGAEGLVHLSELAWGHITHPRQALSIGDEVDVEVISISQESRRIGLSRRRVLSDPWDEVATSMRRGQLVRGRVTKLTKFGAFARLIDNDAVEGLIHISELAGERVSHPREVVQRGDELVLRIVKIDIKERRLGLSLKSVNSTEYLDLDWEMAIQESASLPQQSAPEEDAASAGTDAED